MQKCGLCAQAKQGEVKRPWMVQQWYGINWRLWAFKERFRCQKRRGEWKEERVASRPVLPWFTFIEQSGRTHNKTSTFDAFSCASFVRRCKTHSALWKGWQIENGNSAVRVPRERVTMPRKRPHVRPGARPWFCHLQMGSEINVFWNVFVLCGCKDVCFFAR